MVKHSSGSRPSDGESGTDLPVYLIHWSAPEWCQSAVRSLRRSTISVAISVIDNSADLDIPDVATIRPGENIGFAGGANVALADWLGNTNRPFCVIGSHDLHVTPAALEILVAAAHEHPRVGILGPNMGKGSTLGVEVGTNLEECEWIPGCCLLLRRDCIEEIGGFDEGFGSYGEDVDLCIRARQAGWTVARHKDAEAHELGAVVGEEKAIRVGANRFRLRRKHEGRVGVFKEYVRVGRRAAASVPLSWLPGARGQRHRSYLRMWGEIVRRARQAR